MMCVFFYEDTTGILNFRVRACSARDVSYYNDDDDDDDDDNDDEMMTILFTLSFRYPILSSSLVAFLSFLFSLFLQRGQLLGDFRKLSLYFFQVARRRVFVFFGFSFPFGSQSSDDVVAFV